MKTGKKDVPQPPSEPEPPKRGRPEVPDEDRKSNTLRIRLTQAQRRAFEEAARLAKHNDVSSWLRGLGDREAKRLQVNQDVSASAEPGTTPSPTPPREVR